MRSARFAVGLVFSALALTAVGAVAQSAQADRPPSRLANNSIGTTMGAAPPALVDLTTTTPMVTITLSRAEVSAADVTAGGTCVRDDRNIATVDGVVLPWMAANTPNVHLTGSVETGVTKDNAEWCAHYKESSGASWSELSTFQNAYGMRFISHSATYATNWANLTPQQQYNESCGSRNAITGHGLLGAEGQFDWPNSKIDTSVQSTYVKPCFYFNRILGSGINTLAWAQANNNEVLTKGVSGGSCNVSGQSCSTISPKKYTLPTQIINKIKGLQAGQHYSLQTYILVTGTNPSYVTNGTRWDCTSPNPANHWSNDVERYCWSDFQTILNFLQSDPNVVVTDPKGVAVAWGMAPPTKP